MSAPAHPVISVLSHFNDLMEQANARLADLDNFDLDARDTASLAAFAALELAYREDAKVLVDYVATNSSTLILELNNR